MSRSKKLLIRLSSAGDVLLTSPLLKMIKEREPDSEIHFVIKAQYADLIRSNPNVNYVHLVQDHANFHQLENLRRELLHENFDTTLDLHNNFRSIYIRKETAKEIRVVEKEIFKRALLVKTKLNLFSNSRSVALKYAQTYQKSIMEVPKPEIFLPEEVIEKIDSLWNKVKKENRKSVFLCPGAKHFTKRWPVEYWTELAKRISQEHQVALIGGEADVEACSEIGRNIDAINFCGTLTLIESTAMLSHASVVVTNDSYLMHAANALGKNLVAIFGSSVKEFGFFPYGVNYKVLEVDGLDCRPCSHIGRESCPKKHFKCMMETKPTAVYEATTALLKP
ncbi:MAG: glycosyltransferase family 9 protein [Bacteroidetes bacterium]|nr:glycosyltransferase family 9 protein [Bacteroidota bacterium]MCL5739034.1 glycosyltransferase family 9 protein [Bacteroidota bacterium]